MADDHGSSAYDTIAALVLAGLFVVAPIVAPLAGLAHAVVQIAPADFLARLVASRTLRRRTWVTGRPRGFLGVWLPSLFASVGLFLLVFVGGVPAAATWTFRG